VLLPGKQVRYQPIGCAVRECRRPLGESTGALPRVSVPVAAVTRWLVLSKRSSTLKSRYILTWVGPHCKVAFRHGPILGDQARRNVKTFLAASFLTTVLIASASASTIFEVGFCRSFSNPSPNNPLSGTFVCPSAASLGITTPLVGEFINYESDYSNGMASTVTTETDWAFSGGTAAFATDTTTSTGGSVSNPAESSDGHPLNPLINLPPILLAGFHNNVTVFGTPTAGFTNKADIGSAVHP
jgi:hypothetical protein